MIAGSWRSIRLDMISFGSVFLELVFGHLAELPGPGEEVFTDEFGVSCGGAVTSASAAAQAGAKAGLCTLLGNDIGSRVVLTHCARAGVELSPSALLPRRCAGITVVLNFASDRGFVSHVPPRSAGERPELDRWYEVLRRERPRWCYLHAGPRIPAFIREAQALGAKVVLDMSLGDERNRDPILECLALADVFVPNEDELIRLTGAGSFESAVATAMTWRTPLVVKRGAAGAVVAGPDGTAEIREGVQHVRVRDRTGAGDAFAGALIAELLRGVPLTRAVVAANAAGSAAVGRLGAVGEVDVAGISTVGPDEMLGDALAVAASLQAAMSAQEGRPAMGSEE
jgi:sugar/nucleoside kinase (ribokinase family)